MITGTGGDGRPVCVFMEGECVPPSIEAARLRGECRVLLLSPLGVLLDVDSMDSYEEFSTDKPKRIKTGGVNAL